MARIPWKAVAAGGLVLGGLAALLRANRSTVPAAPKRMALIGDSYAVGLGPELAKIFPDFRYEGHVGNLTSQWAAHSAACGTCGDWLTTFKPDVVLVSLGVNDGDTPNRANYQTLVSGLHGLGARVIWIEPPAGVNTPAVRAVIASLGVPTVPATTTPLAGDGLHPTSYGPWGREVAAVVTHA
jgi:hypothetical protein